MLSFVLLMFTLLPFAVIPAASLEIYIPDTAEIPDPEITETSGQTSDDPPYMVDDPEPDEGTETKKEKETVPTPVHYKEELITPTIILLILAVAVFAISCFLKNREKK